MPNEDCPTGIELKMRVENLETRQVEQEKTLKKIDDTLRGNGSGPGVAERIRRHDLLLYAALVGIVANLIGVPEAIKLVLRVIGP